MWDEECRTEKKVLRKIITKWQKGERDGEKYKEKRKGYRKLCGKKKERRMKGGLRERWKLKERVRCVGDCK